MKNINKSIKRGISSILAATFAVCAPLINVYASAESADTSSETILGVLSENDIPECLALEVSENSKFAARLYEKETALDTVLFANKDGSETVYIFNEDVKYMDESGIVADKSNKLYSNIESLAYSSDYSYVNKENDINTYFPKSLKTNVGVSVEAQGQAIEMYPVSDVISQVTADDDLYGVYYDDVFGEFTGIRYEPSFSGYKEDIILEKNVGNTFRFILETGDLMPVLEDGVIYIRDENGADFGLISLTYVYDSFTGDPSLDESRHFTYNNKFELTQISDGKYELIVIVDEEFLNNPATVYPVIVDPSITINATGSGSSKSILDTPIYNGSGATGTAGANSLAVVGYVDSSYGSGRLLMRFPGLMKQSFMSQNYKIDSATLTMNECSGGSATSTIYAYNYTGPAWDETTKYSSSAYNGVGSSIDFWSFSYPNNTTRTYNITSAVQSWQLDSSKGNKGIIFKNTTSESDYSKTKTFYTTEGTTKPYLSVTYFFNGCKSVKSTSSETMNCQGFAFFTDDSRLTSLKSQYPEDWGYINWPKMNSYPSNSSNTQSVSNTALDSYKSDMRTWLNRYFNSRWTSPNAYDYNLSSDQWLVAMRVGAGKISYTGNDPVVKANVDFFNDNIKFDYHYLYRASNGKWYNKHGNTASEIASGTWIDPASTAANSSDAWALSFPTSSGGEISFYYYKSSTVFYAVR